MARLLVFLVLLWGAAAAAQVVQVRLEPFPPLITESGGGYTVALLRAVERHSDLRFDIQIVPYSRAKYQLRNGQAQLIGHTPVGFESDEFYGYAEELGWQVPTAVDLFAMTPHWLALAAEPSSYYVGTPLGNAEFFSALFAIPQERFVESTLPNLVQMLAKGRIQLLLFERASTRAYLFEAGLHDVHYRFLRRISAGLAVARTEEGALLKQRLEAVMAEVDQQALLGDYLSLLGETAQRGVLGPCPPTDVTNAYPRVCPQE